MSSSPSAGSEESGEPRQLSQDRQAGQGGQARRKNGDRLAVVAFGGNALLRSSDDGTVASQLERAEAAAEWLSQLVQDGSRLVIVHGNGPQVGQIMIQMEAAADRVPPGSLDVAVSQTEGSMGYLMELALRNRFNQDGIPGHPGSLLSLVVVDRDDPGFEEPTKPVGPYFPADSARALSEQHGWEMREESDGWRKVVSSPRPLEILGLDLVEELLHCCRIVMAGGGGGVPVVRREDGRLEGVEAVIDKDRTASLLARELEADLFLILTNVARVKKGFGTAEEEEIEEMTLEEARALLEAGEFPAGSMGPKVEAAIDFVAATGRPVVITDIDHVHEAVAGRAGTRLVVDPDAGSERSERPERSNTRTRGDDEQ